MEEGTWSKSCFPVVLCWMANSSSASIVVTRTVSWEEKERERESKEMEIKRHIFSHKN